MIIGITGKSGAGKDTAASYFEESHKLAFVKPLKDSCKILFNFTDEQLYDPIKKEEIDPMWGKSPREILQWMGTEILRTHINTDFFILHMKQRILALTEKSNKTQIIITDVRFDNEAELIKSLGGIIINITRPSVDSKKDGKYVHSSESGINKSFIDCVIENNGTIDELFEKLKPFKIQKVT